MTKIVEESKEVELTTSKEPVKIVGISGGHQHSHDHKHHAGCSCGCQHDHDHADEVQQMEGENPTTKSYFNVKPSKVSGKALAKGSIRRIHKYVKNYIAKVVDTTPETTETTKNEVEFNIYNTEEALGLGLPIVKGYVKDPKNNRDILIVEKMTPCVTKDDQTTTVFDIIATKQHHIHITPMALDKFATVHKLHYPTLVKANNWGITEDGILKLMSWGYPIK